MPCILIIDDDVAIRDALTEALSDLGHIAVALADGDSALGWLAQHRADAVLLDLRLPGLDGMEILRRIRRRGNPPPVAVLTAVAIRSRLCGSARLTILQNPSAAMNCAHS